MIEEDSLRARRGFTLQSLPFVLVGFGTIALDIAITNWTLTLPDDIGQYVWTGIFTLGAMIIVFSSRLARVSLPFISKTEADLLESWEKSGNLAIVLNDLSRNETLSVLGFTRRHFGKYLSDGVTTPRGRVFTSRRFRVGYKIQPVGLERGQVVFDLILYRRDLAELKRIRRPWRPIVLRSGSLEPLRPSRPIRLPDWILAEKLVDRN